MCSSGHRAGGKGYEEFVRRAIKDGARYRGASPDGGGASLCAGADTLTCAVYQADLFLAAAMRPQPSAGTCAKIKLGADGSGFCPVPDRPVGITPPACISAARAIAKDVPSRGGRQRRQKVRSSQGRLTREPGSPR